DLILERASAERSEHGQVDICLPVQSGETLDLTAGARASADFLRELEVVKSPELPSHHLLERGREPGRLHARSARREVHGDLSERRILAGRTDRARPTRRPRRQEDQLGARSHRASDRSWSCASKGWPSAALYASRPQHTGFPPRVPFGEVDFIPKLA